MKRRSVLAVAASSLAVLAGCPGDASEGPSTSTPAGTTGTPASTSTPAPEGPETTAAAAAALIEDMAAGRFEQAYERFGSSRRNAVSPGALEALWLAYTNVAGLSLGAMAVPRIARRDGDLAGCVAMAAPARSFHAIVLDQYDTSPPSASTSGTR